MSIISKAIEAARAAARVLADGVEPVLPDVADAPLPTDCADEVAALKEALTTQQRISREYFDVIERVVKEREGWKEMYFVQSGEHQNAQTMLMRSITVLTTQLRDAVRQLNFLRVKAGLELIHEPSGLKNIPENVPTDFAEKIKAMTAAVPTQTDGEAERNRIASTAK